MDSGRAHRGHRHLDAGHCIMSIIFTYVELSPKISWRVRTRYSFQSPVKKLFERFISWLTTSVSRLTNTPSDDSANIKLQGQLFHGPKI
jgi:hypothetical protein